MTATNEEPLRVLRFWRDLEIFNIPSAPSARDSNDQAKVVTLRRRQSRSDALPWDSEEFKPTERFGYVHVVYVGVADAEDLSRLLLRALFPNSDLSERERQRLTGTGWLGAFVVNESGQPRLDSYVPASFAHAVAALRYSNALDSINARLARAKDEFGQRRHRLAGERPGERMNWDALDEEFDVVRNLLGGEAKDQRLDWRVVVRTSRVRRRELDDDLPVGTDFLNSFYLDDLDRLIAQAERKQDFGSALATYLGPALPEQRRTDILDDAAAMAHLVSAKRLPGARWPASPRHPLVLAQQAAVAEVMSGLGQSQGLIGINGPPGTGKTTLLCDVIAGIVTERARRIAALDRPVALFEERTTVAGKGFFPLRAEVVGGSSIVVTSTNNNAVKNITQELPARKKVDGEFGAVDYFAEVMREVFRVQKVLDESRRPIDTWGAIAAALGNVGNRRSFAQGFFRDEYVARPQAGPLPAGAARPAADDEPADAEPEDATTADARPPSMRQLLETASSHYATYLDEWRNAKRAFLALQAEFERCRRVLEEAEQAARSLDDVRERRDAILAQGLALDRDVSARETALDIGRGSLANQRAVVGARQTVLDQLTSATVPNLWDRLLGLFGRETRRMAQRRRALEQPTRELAEASDALAAASQALAVAQSQLDQQRALQRSVASTRAALERELEGLQRAVQAGFELGATHFPDAQFWRLPTDVRHRASVAVGPRLDDLRGRLFLQALDLHRLTILANASKFIANLRAVNGMLTGSTRDRLAAEHRPWLWDAFFFVVPVVSTTLASFDRLFAGMGQNSLGWLLIDEAGQATPQSAAGAIWRCRRVVVVGDPLQIEPVFTVPLSLAEDLRHRHGVPVQWSPIDESVQTLADRITPWGSWIRKSANPPSPETPERLWTGMPLRTHRRCDDPMFSVANQIAYDGQMVQGRTDAAGRPTPWDFSCGLGACAWLDVRSARVNHPVSEDEIACLLDCLVQMRRGMDAPAKTYVISPFRRVAQACSRRLRDAGWQGIECGTVHTFQGKEAHVVFLVLGTAPGQAGSGARSWAARNPNLLNVAITRAKCRLYVIGDASEWGGQPYFGQLLRALAQRRVAPLPP